MKKVAIVCDNYKLERFKKELDREGYKYELFPFVEETTSIKIECKDDQVSKVHAICIKIESHFKRSN